jgi:hypothetical protein
MPSHRYANMEPPQLIGQKTVDEPRARSADYMRAYRVLLTFRFDAGRFLGEPYFAFEPRGLVIWGAPPRSVIEQCVITNRRQIVVSFPPAPTEFFSMAKSYEQIAEMLARDGTEPPSWCTFDRLIPGQSVELRIKSCNEELLGPNVGIRLCMWGIALE